MSFSLAADAALSLLGYINRLFGADIDEKMRRVVQNVDRLSKLQENPPDPSNQVEIDAVNRELAEQLALYTHLQAEKRRLTLIATPTPPHLQHLAMKLMS